MTTTTDLAEFGHRERAMLEELLKAWREQGLPEDFWNEDVKPMMNKHSGYVFLTNAEYQVAMLNGNKLESFYSSPYEGHEGFFEELAEQYEHMNYENQEWLEDIAEQLGRTDELS